MEEVMIGVKTNMSELENLLEQLGETLQQISEFKLNIEIEQNREAAGTAPQEQLVHKINELFGNKLADNDRKILRHALAISQILVDTENPHTKIEIDTAGVKKTSDSWFCPSENYTLL